MKKEKHLFCPPRGLRVGLACLLVAVLLVMGISCTRDGMDPSDTSMESSAQNGTVADSNVGSVTSSNTEKHTTASTRVPDTVIPDTMNPTTERVTERITERVTTQTPTDTSAVTSPAITGKARGGK